MIHYCMVKEANIGYIQKQMRELQEFYQSLLQNIQKIMGQLFKDLYLAADRDYYKMDLNIHLPAQVEIFNMTTGNIFKAGGIREDII